MPKKVKKPHQISIISKIRVQYYRLLLGGSNLMERIWPTNDSTDNSNSLELEDEGYENNSAVNSLELLEDEEEHDLDQMKKSNKRKYKIMKTNQRNQQILNSYKLIKNVVKSSINRRRDPSVSLNSQPKKMKLGFQFLNSTKDGNNYAEPSPYNTYFSKVKEDGIDPVTGTLIVTDKEKSNSQSTKLFEFFSRLSKKQDNNQQGQGDTVNKKLYEAPRTRTGFGGTYSSGRDENYSFQGPNRRRSSYDDRPSVSVLERFERRHRDAKEGPRKFQIQSSVFSNEETIDKSLYDGREMVYEPQFSFSARYASLLQKN